MASTSNSAPVLDSDIWGIIVGHLQVDLKWDQPQEISMKRKALLHIALLSSRFSELGLNALWKHMTTLEPILSSCTDLQGGQAVLFIPGWPEGSWREINSITSDQRNRMKDHLSRIRHFRPLLHYGQQMKEATLWTLLFGLLGCLQVLLPNLRSLEILLGEGSGWAWGHLIYPLLSCSLERITFKDLQSGPPHLGIHATHRQDFEHVFTMLDERSIGLSSIEYQGYSSIEAFHLISRFAGLRRLSLRPTNNGFIHNPDMQQSSHVILPDLLSHFPVLEYLKVDLDIFAVLPVTESVLPSNLNFTLKSIHILGSCNDIRHFFRRCHMNLPSITSLKITVAHFSDHQAFWTECLTSSFSMFPNIKELSLRSKLRPGGGQLQTESINVTVMEHILSKSSITSFIIKDVLHSFELHGLWRMTNSWPRIRRLKLGRYAIRCYVPSLIIFSTYLPFLEELEIPITSRSLINLIIPPEHISICPLNQIGFIYDTHTNDLNFAEKVLFVEKLMALFPMLKLINNNMYSSWQLGCFHMELQMLITLSHGSAMHRWTFLQRNNSA